jgi:hypothetical protein
MATGASAAPAPAGALPTFTFDLPPGYTKSVAGNLVAAGNRPGNLAIVRVGRRLEVTRRADPPPFLVPLDWRCARAGIVGDADSLRRQVETWPLQARRPLVDPASGPGRLAAFEARPEPDSALDLALAVEAAESILSAAPDAATFVAFTVRIARHLLDWYPNGQMLAWGVNAAYVLESRTGALLAAAQATGWGAVQRTLRAGRLGSLWGHGRDLSRTSQLGSLYLNLANHQDTSGVSVRTLPVVLIFEFGDLLILRPSLTFLETRYLRSFADATNLAPDLPPLVDYPRVGPIERDSLREWFVTRFNALADRLIRLENFRTRAGELRPLVMQQTQVTLGNLLHLTGHLLASPDFSTQRVVFWDLVDLYGKLVGGGDLSKSFGQDHWTRHVIPAMATLPGALAPLFTQYARRLYDEWVRDIVEGISDPKRRLRTSVVLGRSGTRRRITHDDYFAKYMEVRRNTLHGYSLRGDQNDYLFIHDDTLPLRIAEWGRLQFITLLAEPDLVFRRLQSLSI